MSDELNELPSSTPDFRSDMAAQLAKLFPEVVADGKIDCEALKVLLGEDAAESHERFGLASGAPVQLACADPPTP